jgi:hypothetical protein
VLRLGWGLELDQLLVRVSESGWELALDLVAALERVWGLELGWESARVYHCNRNPRSNPAQRSNWLP